MSSNRRIQTYIDKYSSEFSFIKKSRRDETSAFCCICNCDIIIAHGGRNDIVVHAKTAKHIKNAKRIETSSKLNFQPTSSSGDLDLIRAEVLFTNFLLEHNLPISAADHATKLFPKMFPNSPEVKKYSCGRTKTTEIIKELSSESTNRIISILKAHTFTVATDGSNDADNNNQLYPIVVTFFDKSSEQVCCKLLSLPSLKSDSSGENIAKLMKDEFKRFAIPWENCLALSCDNANVMIGKNKGVGTILKEKQPNLIVWGCMCHLLNLAAEKGSAALPLSFDELLLDIFYYLKKSSKRKQNLQQYQNLHNAESKQILKHCVTRWLSLGKCLGRLLDQWDGVLQYFKNESLIALRVKQPPAITLKRKAESHSDKKMKRLKQNDEKVSKKGNSSTFSVNSATSTSAKTNIKNSEKKLEKSILSREERIFLCLSSDLYRALAFFTIFLLYNLF